MSAVTPLLNRTVDQYRHETARNATGGLDETRVLVGQVEVRISQPSATERVMSRTQVGPQQGQAELTQPVYAEPDADIRRGDELEDADTGEVWRVVARVAPSKGGVYLRLDVELLQAELTEEAS